MSDGNNQQYLPMRDRASDAEELFADHVAHPRGQGELALPLATVKRSRPVCGDEVTLQVGLFPKGVDGDQRCAIRANATGCAVHRAVTSLLCVVMEGCTVAECEERLGAFQRMMAAGADAHEVTRDRALLGDAVILTDMRRFPARLPCVMTSWNAFGECLEKIKLVGSDDRA